MAGFKAWFNTFKETFVGKLVLSAARAFIGVFIAAEAAIFNDVVNLINNHTIKDLNTLEALLLALVAAGFTAAVRAVQHFFFDE